MWYAENLFEILLLAFPFLENFRSVIDTAEIWQEVQQFTVCHFAIYVFLFFRKKGHNSQITPL
jgi:hypothetical protein